VPIGGALIYVPADWVHPANIGVDKLTAVYVSMGITPPDPPAQGLSGPRASAESREAAKESSDE
jgi:uncharacterized membrane protein